MAQSIRLEDCYDPIFLQYSIFYAKLTFLNILGRRGTSKTININKIAKVIKEQTLRTREQAYVIASQMSVVIAAWGPHALYTQPP